MIQRLIVHSCITVALTVVCLPSIGQTAVNPWNGSWKVDPTSFHYQGVTYTVTTDAQGYSVAMGDVPVGKTDCTGKPVSNPSGTQSTCVKSSNGYTSTTTKDGKTLSVVTWTVSSGGKKLTRTLHAMPADEAPYTMTLDYDRVGEGKGFAGTWKETGFSESQDTGILGIEVTGDSVALKETDSPKPVVCKLDGIPTPFGSNTMTVKLVDPRTLKVDYLNGSGKIVRENTFALNPDGNMISETDFTTNPTPSAMTLVFHKM